MPNDPGPLIPLRPPADQAPIKHALMKMAPGDAECSSPGAIP